MLIDFTVENFRSFKEAQTLSLLRTNSKEKPDNYFELDREKKIKLLKSAVIYGANASGKSNLIRAMQTMLEIIHSSTDYKVGQSISLYYPFKLDSESATQPTRFDIEFVCDSVRYRYSFSYTSEGIVDEALFFYPNKSKVKLFIREKGKPIDFGNALKGSRKTIEEQLLDNVLFLSKGANSNNEMLEKIYSHLGQHFQIDAGRLSNFRVESNIATNTLMNSENPIKFSIYNFMTNIDPGIEGIYVEKDKIEEKNIRFPDNVPEHIQKGILEVSSLKVRSLHKAKGFDKPHIIFDFDEESDGTIKAYSLAGILLVTLDRGGLFAIDELNNSLHPIIVRFIVDLFNSEKSNSKNAQLIFSTHDTTLLDPDIFRRDQIWFTEKDNAGATKLYSLSEFDYKEIRKDTPFNKWYLTGRFGAIPLVNDFNVLAEEIANAQNTKTEPPQS